jgi:hypothetical protein
MAFLLYHKKVDNDKVFYINKNQNYKLGGYGLIFQAWVQKGKPINKGWSATANELLSNYDSNFEADKHLLLIDFDPNSKYRIGIIEIEKIHVYTYGNEEDGSVYNVFYEEEYDCLSVEEKGEIISKIEVGIDRGRNIEFLYLQGGWNWGRNGSTNAAFIPDEARNFFRQFF